MVKDRVGRPRYVVFLVEGAAVEKASVIQALREASRPLPEEARPWLVSLEEGVGVVRCRHTAKEDVIRLLRGVRRVGGREVRVRTLGTSGTLRRARAKYVEPRLRS